MRYVLSLLLSVFVVAIAANVHAQSFPADDGVETPESDRAEVVPGEILVRFKDGVQVVSSKKGGIEVKAASADSVFRDVEVTASEALFPGAEPQAKGANARFETYSGHTVDRPSLHNIYKVSIKEPAQQARVIRELQQQDEVVYAEPNYIYEVVGEPTSPVMETPKGRTSVSLPPDDPLYDQQYQITATNIDDVWADTTGSDEQVIAILDTGVDTEHPDLENKIWTNPDEADGADGVDDDDNGYVDDVNGWDFINNDADPADDNSHGTHVAGLAAAEMDNGIGLAGAGGQARIMPIKVLQSTGRGDAATIAQGIAYAEQMGADVLNMSFGSFARSTAIEDALAAAYGDAVLVGAAGNNRIPLCPAIVCDEFFPAAFSFVLGIEATGQGGALAGFSNYDNDGPVKSIYPDRLNYEIQAPGVGLTSTIPDGAYQEYSGTSMAAPVVAGAVSLYQTLFPNHSQELMYGNLINTLGAQLDLAAATSAQSEPNLSIIDQAISDSVAGDGDGRVDAGETVRIVPTIRNTWAQADSVQVRLGFAPFEDTTVASIETESVPVGGISAYASKRPFSDSLEISVDSALANNRDISLQLDVWHGGPDSDTTSQDFSVTVESGEEIGGLITENKTLTPDSRWLVTENLFVESDDTLTVEPGTEVQIAGGKGITIAGTLTAEGTPDSLVTFTKGEGDVDKWRKISFTEGGKGILKYCIIEKGNSADDINGGLIKSPRFGGEKITLKNCIIRDNKSRQYIIRGENIELKKSNILRNESEFASIVSDEGESISKSNISNNTFGAEGISEGGLEWNGSRNLYKNNFVSNISAFGGKKVHIDVKYADQGNVAVIPPNYFGTSDSTRIQPTILDFFEDSNKPVADYSSYLSQPSDSAHGIVWKVEVNGTGAQDERDQLDPVGVGEVRFDVHFNTQMDTSVTPEVGFGVRPPFYQNAVTEGSWAPDSTVWTGFYDVDLTTGDGINGIRVAGARDTSGFKIPVEDERFRFTIDASGAASQDFVADAGLGQVDLSWTPPDKEDLLGYNVYRFENETDSTYTDTTRINDELVTDTTYTDFEVQPDSNYYYQYTVVSSSFDESDKSQVAAAEVLTADPGDANGDQSVNVLDVTTTTAYILDQDPSPFIFGAADINEDDTVNILDVVGVVDIVLGGSQAGKTFADATATLHRDDGRLLLDASEAVGGVELSLTGARSGGVRALEVPEGIEVSRARTAGDTLSVLVYGMGGTTIPAGEQPLLAVGDSASVGSAVVSDPSGNAIETTISSAREDLPEEFVLEDNYPNPVRQSTKIPYRLKSDVEQVSVGIYDILGRRVATLRPEHRTAGRHELQFRADRLASGVYFYRMSVTTPDGSRRQVGTEKMVVIR